MDKEKFESKFIPEPNTGCWLWLGASDKNGRGKLTINRKNFNAHRISYEIYKGKIKSGLFVCHSCDTPACVNPEHLWLGTQKDNMRDMGDKKRSKFHKGSFFGSTHGMSKLTEKQVLEIRNRYVRGNGAILAKEFNVSISSIHLIKKNKIWKHVK